MKNLDSIYTIGLWLVKEGNDAAFIDTWEEFAKWTKENQPGSIEGTLLQNVEQPRRFISFGPWKNEESIQAWRQNPKFKEFLIKTKNLCEEIQPGWKSVVHVK